VRDHLFRADLFFRLNVLRVELPALRDRRGDIEVLSRHFSDAARATRPRREIALARKRSANSYCRTGWAMCASSTTPCSAP